MKSALLALIAAAALPLVAHAQQPTPELQALDDALPGTLINDPSRLDWAIYGTDRTNKIAKAPDIPGGGAAVQVTITKAGTTAYAVGANVPVRTAIASGKDYVVAFYARTISADLPDGKGRIGVRFQQNAEPYPGFGDTTLTIGSDWQLYEVAARADRDIAKGQAIIAFQLSGAKQVVEIGQTIVVEGATALRAAVTKQAEPEPQLPPQIAGRGRLLNDPADRNWGSYGALATAKPTVTNVFGRVGTLFSVSAAGKNPFDAGASAPIAQAIAEGDVLVVGVLARTVSAATTDGAGLLSIRIQGKAAPYPGFADATLKIGPNWRLYQLRTQAPQSFSAGAAQLALHVAGAKQDIEIGPVYVVREELVAAPAPAP